MSIYKFARWCFVPECYNTSKNSPEKLFFPVPNDPETKKLWFQMAHRAGEPTTSRYYCCQDHFELKEDMDNYVRYSIDHGPIKLKKGVLPHIFDCQNRSKSTNSIPRLSNQNQVRKRLNPAILVENGDKNTGTVKQDPTLSPNSKRQALMSIENQKTLNSAPRYDGQSADSKTGGEQKIENSLLSTVSTPISASADVDLDLDCSSNMIRSPPDTQLVECCVPDTVKAQPMTAFRIMGQNFDQNHSSFKTVSPCNVQVVENLAPYTVKNQMNSVKKIMGQTLDQNYSSVMIAGLSNVPVVVDSASDTNIPSSAVIDQSCRTLNDSPDSSMCMLDPYRILNFGEDIPPEQSYRRLKNCGVQVSKNFGRPRYRSIGMMCKPKFHDVACQQQVEMKNQACSPIRSLFQDTRSESFTTPSSSTYTSTGTSDAKITSDDFKSSDTFSSEEEKQVSEEMKHQAIVVSHYFISMNPKYYIGISMDWLWVVDLLHAQSGLNIDYIRLTLWKIRCNDTFTRLGDHFGISASHAGRIFNNTVPVLAHFLKTLVYPVQKSSIKKNLPIPFRANYHDVYMIIDTFETEIQKPSNPVHQALSWSEYKKGNTLKYLIAITADGTIIFISIGYGGRITDVQLFRISGIMDIIPENSSVMADRGFKQIDAILSEKNCKLVRPPSVSRSEKLTKEEAILTKRIASLRIHVERVIRRVREFEILKPHADLDLTVMSNIDDIVMIVCALINLQTPIMKS